MPHYWLWRWRKGPQAKGCRWPPGAGKGQDSPLKLPEGMNFLTPVFNPSETPFWLLTSRILSSILHIDIIHSIILSNVIINFCFESVRLWKLATVALDEYNLSIIPQFFFFYSSLSELNLMLGELVLAPELIKDNLILPPHQLKRLFQEVAPDWSSPSPFLDTVFKLLMPAHEAQSYQIPVPPWGIPSWLSGKELACQCRRYKRCGFNPWVGKIPRRKWQPTPVFLPGKSQEQRSLAATVHGVAKSWTQLSHQTMSPWLLPHLLCSRHTSLLCIPCTHQPPTSGPLHLLHFLPRTPLPQISLWLVPTLHWISAQMALLRESIPDCSIYETPMLTSLFYISPFYLLHGTYDKLKCFKL